MLVVDDEHIVSLTLSHIFTAAGYDTRAVQSAEEGLALIERWPPHLAVIDVCLPCMNGVEFAIQLTTICSDCRFLLFSGQPDTSAILDTAAARGYDLEVMPKPVQPTVLLQLSAELLSTT